MWSSIDSSTTAQSIENYNSEFPDLKFSPVLYIWVSFLTILDKYKAYFKGRHTCIQRPRDLFSLCEAIAFVRYKVL